MPSNPILERQARVEPDGHGRLRGTKGFRHILAGQLALTMSIGSPASSGNGVLGAVGFDNRPTSFAEMADDDVAHQPFVLDDKDPRPPRARQRVTLVVIDRLEHPARVKAMLLLNCQPASMFREMYEIRQTAINWAISHKPSRLLHRPHLM